MLREDDFSRTVVEMIRRAETRLPGDVERALKKNARAETHPPAKLHYDLMLKNIEIARKRERPICQDTGTMSFFIKIGRNLRINFDIADALAEAVGRATDEVPLRANVVDPITRRATSDNAGEGHPVLHLEITKGDRMRIDLLVRGSGAENCSRLFMLGPTEGQKAIERAVLSAIADAGGKPCPPTIVGVGIGGTSETACIMAKRALLRPLDKNNPDPVLNRLERIIGRSANRLGIGCMGLGGKTTVLGVRIEKAACHTASLPVAVAFQCWVARRAGAELKGDRLMVVEP
ncbi:MAG: fumarate hydratase [Candidatus Hadarchaeales archaeon]